MKELEGEEVSKTATPTSKPTSDEDAVIVEAKPSSGKAKKKAKK